MPTIRRLPETLVNRIAAGEVVERPASAVKELVENALDAGARNIVVKLSEGGLTAIEVLDDGCGMARDEIALALERHATSKLPGEDIENVATLGFRGEALPSIASVARLTVESRAAGSSEGWRRIVDNGALIAEEPAAVPPGTRIRVEQIFARVPARRKFMRTPRAEWGACLDAVRRLALARPEVGFMLEHDGRRALAVQPGTSVAARAAELIARELADNAVEIEFVRGTVRLSGIAGLPTYNRGVADHQYLFVNGRPVKDRLLTGAVRGAYADMLARDRHAVLALFVEVPAAEVDVNVHPAKTEVRFRDAAGVRGVIVSGLRAALATGDKRSVQAPANAAMRAWVAEPIMPGADRRSIFGGAAGALPSQAASPRARPPGGAGTPRCSMRPRAGRKPPPRRFLPQRRIRSGLRADRSPPLTSSRRRRMAWSSSTSTPPTSAWCSSGCVQPTTGPRRPARRCCCPKWSNSTRPTAIASRRKPRRSPATA
jgi:DNA mismatch repair protein MutL